MKRSSSSSSETPRVPRNVSYLSEADIFSVHASRDESVLAHQCNCVTKQAAGLAASVFARFPDADTYTRDSVRRTPGTATVHGRVANLYAQRYPGHPKKYETAEQRLQWFAASLRSLSALLKSERRRTVLLPHGIGCAMAGGDWHSYEQLIWKWARDNEEWLDVVVCSKEKIPVDQNAQKLVKS